LYRRWIGPSEAVLRCKEETFDETYWMGKFRQYAHVVDKGLHRGDFTKGHGSCCYQLAKEAFLHIKSERALNDPSIIWAMAKINQYEQIQTDGVLWMKTAHTGTTCRYEDLLDVIRTRRSIRRYVNRTVEDTVIEKIADVLNWSPTSCSRQPARLYATNNPAIVRKATNLHSGAACFTDIYAPLFLIFCADSRLYSMPGELSLPYIDVTLGVENCLLVAHTLGISLTPLTCTGLSDSQEHQLRELFGIPWYFQIVVSAVGGYPDGGAEVPARKTKEFFIRR